MERRASSPVLSGGDARRSIANRNMDVEREPAFAHYQLEIYELEEKTDFVAG